MGDVGSAPPSAAASSRFLPRRIVSPVQRWLSEPERRLRLLISAGGAAGFILLVYIYAGGGLLYAIDYPGIYTPGDFLIDPSANYIVPSIAAGLSFGNVYVAKYLSLFVDALLCAYGRSEEHTSELSHEQ
jgi:hypothetical protein